VVNGSAQDDKDRTTEDRGARRLPLRFLVGVDEKEAIPDLVAYVGTAGANGRAIARVVHVVELVGHPRLGIESIEVASDMIDEATFLLRMSGVGADGILRQARPTQIGQVLLEEANHWNADAVVLLARRAGPWRRLLGPGVRQQLIRHSSTTTVLVSRQRLAPARP